MSKFLRFSRIFLRSSAGIFLGLMGILSAGALVFSNYSELNRPWFAPSWWGVGVVWVFLGLSLARGYRVLRRAPDAQKDECLERIYTGLWVGYVLGIYTFLRVGVPFLSLLWAFGFLALLAASAYLTRNSLRLERPLRLAVYLTAYLGLIGLYLTVNNPLALV